LHEIGIDDEQYIADIIANPERNANCLYVSNIAEIA
jgi:hypothetical protein